MEHYEFREDICRFMRRLYDRQLTTATGGNISCRLPDGGFLITPSGKDKGSLTPEDIGHLGPSGDNLTPCVRLSMETRMHLAIYAVRPEITAIVHAHPPYATSYAIAEKPLNCNLAGEARALLGEPAYAPYALMGTDDLARNVADTARKANAILMHNHGAITLGKSLLLAYERLEVLEMTAKISFITEMLGQRRELAPEELKKIDKLFEGI